MSIKLHYGPPGSYKTSGAIYDDLPIAVKEGRVLITNIRGLNDADLVKKVFKRIKKPVNDEFSIIYLDTKKEEEREKFRKFYHWAPQDSYFIVDEINTIYPKDWRAAKLKEYDLHNGSPEELKDEKNQLKDRWGQLVYDVETDEPIIRPQNLVEALEMHRHFNFDFSCTSPSYKKFHPIFHDVAEMAYGHINRAIIGITGYWETVHTADNTGKSKADQLSVDNKKIPKWVFEVYQSTATGQIRDTTAGINIFLKPRVIAPIVLAVAVIIYGISELKRVGMLPTDKKETKQVDTNVNSRTKTIPKNIIQVQNNKIPIQSNNHANNISSRQETPNSGNTSNYNPDFLSNYQIYLTGDLWNEKYIKIEKDHDVNEVKISNMEKLGYKFVFIDLCLATVTYKDNLNSRTIMCPPRSNKGSLGQQINYNPFATKEQNNDQI